MSIALRKSMGKKKWSSLFTAMRERWGKRKLQALNAMREKMRGSCHPDGKDWKAGEKNRGAVLFYNTESGAGKLAVYEKDV